MIQLESRFRFDLHLFGHRVFVDFTLVQNLQRADELRFLQSSQINNAERAFAQRPTEFEIIGGEKSIVALQSHVSHAVRHDRFQLRILNVFLKNVR